MAAEPDAAHTPRPAAPEPPEPLAATAAPPPAPRFAASPPPLLLLLKLRLLPPLLRGALTPWRAGVGAIGASRKKAGCASTSVKFTLRGGCIGNWGLKYE